MEINHLPLKQRFDQLLDLFPEANFLQSWQWGEANRHRHKIERLTVEHDGNLLAGVQIIIKNARRGRYAEIPGGPLVDWQNKTLVQSIFDEIKQVAKSNKCVFIRIRPQLIEGAESQLIFHRLGAMKAPMHLHAEHTNIIDLSQEEEVLLAAMRRQTRYEVRRAAKHHLSVMSSDRDGSLVNLFVSLQAETAKRQGFIPPSYQEIKAIFDEFGDKARIYQVVRGATILNMALVVRTGQEADYLEAASTPEARGESGSYALVWQAIKDAKLTGATRFNLWGIAYNDNPRHRYAGVTTFKRGFGGRDKTYLSAQDIVLKPMRYKLNLFVEFLRRRRRGL